MKNSPTIDRTTTFCMLLIAFGAVCGKRKTTKTPDSDDTGSYVIDKNNVVFNEELDAYDNGAPLSAYAVQTNEAELKGSNPSISMLQWKSLGIPRLIKNDNNVAVHFVGGSSSESEAMFECRIQLLTPPERQVLANAANKKLKDRLKPPNKISPEQITLLKPNKFACTFLASTILGKEILLDGQVNDISQVPFRLQFRALNPIELSEDERNEFKRGLKGRYTLDCDVEIVGSVDSSSLSVISTSAIRNVKLEEDVFGDASEKYVTRYQVASMSVQVAKKLTVFSRSQNPEDDEDEFSKQFMNGIVQQQLLEFKHMDIDDALQCLSAYTINIAQDLVPNKFKEELSNIIVKDKSSKKDHLKRNKTETAKGSSDVKVKLGGEVGIPGFLTSKVQHEVDVNHNWDNADMDAKDQLNELNKDEETTVHWEMKGDKVVPKSIAVALLKKANLGSMFENIPSEN